MWAAKSGLGALTITWDDGPNGLVSSGEIWDRLRKASARDGSVAKERGDLGRTTVGSGDVFTRVYEMPLLAHACMEPMNCTVHVTSGAAEVWIGTQVIERVRQAVAKSANPPEEKVTVHNHLAGHGLQRSAGEGACASCHSWSGVSLLANEATLTGNRSVNDSSATNVAQIVLSGERRQTPHGVVMMPAFGPTYSDAEIAAVANYVVARFGAKVSSLTAKDVAKLRQ